MFSSVDILRSLRMFLINQCVRPSCSACRSGSFPSIKECCVSCFFDGGGDTQAPERFYPALLILPQYLCHIIAMARLHNSLFSHGSIWYLPAIDNNVQWIGPIFFCNIVLIAE